MNGNLTEFATLALFNEHVWRYRHSPSGEREQIRVYEEPQPDNNGRAYLWVYYQLAGSRQLAVWNGLQTHDTSCGSGAREVWLYATEYLTYGVGDAHALSFKPNGGKRYKIADHLGSTRMVIDENGVIRSQFEYAPFGEQIANYGSSMTAPRKGFIDKEQDVENNLSDFSARKFDESLGRFTSVDALWEKYRSLSPYHYAANDPLRLKDPSGDVVKPAEGSSLTQEDIDRGLDILAKTSAKPFVEYARREDILVYVDIQHIPDDNYGPRDAIARHYGAEKNHYRNKEIVTDEQGIPLVHESSYMIHTTIILKDDVVQTSTENEVLSIFAEEIVHVNQAHRDPQAFYRQRREDDHYSREYDDKPFEIEAQAVREKVEKELKKANPEGEGNSNEQDGD